MIDLLLTAMIGLAPDTPTCVFNPNAIHGWALKEDAIGSWIIQTTPHYFTPIIPDPDVRKNLMKNWQPAPEPFEIDPGFYKHDAVPVDLGDNSDA